MTFSTSRVGPGFAFDCWKRNAAMFPILARLAKVYLAVQATSAPSERVFRLASRIISKKREGLEPGSASKLLLRRRTGICGRSKSTSTNQLLKKREWWLRQLMIWRWRVESMWMIYVTWRIRQALRVGTDTDRKQYTNYSKASMLRIVLRIVLRIFANIR